MSLQKHKIIILGAGPAGITAAIYAARAHLNPIILEGPKPGGQLMGTSEVENWPGHVSILGPQLMISMIEQAKQHGAQFISESAIAVNFSKNPFEVITQQGNSFLAESAIIATGSTPNKLNCPGEEEYWGKGVATCTTCDGAFYKDKKVVVLGGGDAAMESASFLSRYTKNITIVHIGSSLKASQIMQDRVFKNPQTSVIYNSTVTEIHGNGKHVTHVTIENQETKQTTDIETDGLFLSIGHKPNTSIFSKQLELSNFGHIIVHDNVKTSIPGIFASGDVHDFQYKQAIVSSGFGCIAALEAERYLETLD